MEIENQKANISKWWFLIGPLVLYFGWIPLHDTFDFFYKPPVYSNFCQLGNPLTIRDKDACAAANGDWASSSASLQGGFCWNIGDCNGQFKEALESRKRIGTGLGLMILLLGIFAWRHSRNIGLILFLVGVSWLVKPPWLIMGFLMALQ